MFDIFNTLGLMLITRLQLGLSHMNENKFDHNFNNCINPLDAHALWISSKQVATFSIVTTIIYLEYTS